MNTTVDEMTLRRWQTDAYKALRRHWSEGRDRALIAACPAAGKTRFGTYVAGCLLQEGEIKRILIVAPSVNVKLQWAEEFGAYGINARRVDNETLRHTIDWSELGNVDVQAIALTYAQLQNATEAWHTFARAVPTLVIADEIHHCDENEAFGIALDRVAEAADRTLALSGTPFTTRGADLALCRTESFVNDDGRPSNRTLATYKYSYGDALNEAADERAIPVARLSLSRSMDLQGSGTEWRMRSWNAAPQTWPEEKAGDQSPTSSTWTRTMRRRLW